jgi:hypothetical protein
MAKAMIDNVELKATGDRRCVLAWTLAGLRYHVWGEVKGDELVLDDGPLFKNPPLGEHSSGYGPDHKYREQTPGYFSTRRLDRYGKTNAAMVAAAVTAVRVLNLIPQMREAEAERKRKEHAEHLAGVRKHRKQMAGEALYDALKLALECGERDGAASALAVLNTHGRELLDTIEGGAQ